MYCSASNQNSIVSINLKYRYMALYMYEVWFKSSRPDSELAQVRPEDYEISQVYFFGWCRKRF